MSALPHVTYGLVGRKLGHSWSPMIHASLGSVPYDLVELEPEQVEPFIREGSWRGLNVTIPYKRAAADAADERTDRVRALGVANTLVHTPDGRILADNTDVLGFEAMLRSFCLEHLGQSSSEAFSGKKALVLGTGGAAQAVSYVLAELVGCRVCFVSRSGESTYQNMLELHEDAALIVNTTPVGMYPNCPASPLQEGTLERLGQLRAVLDVVYNPLRTGICLQAERAGIPCSTGLSMLVWQAVYASELFQGKTLDHGLVGDITGGIVAQTTNVAFIGMPGVGKTTAGRSLARLVHRPFVDLDDAFTISEGMSPAECISRFGEDAFRARETAVLRDCASRSGIVMACGGGVVTRPENYDLLRQNSTIIMLDRPIDQLSSKGRPLSQQRGLKQLARERMDLYRAWADHVVTCTGSASSDAASIREMLGI